MKHNPSGISSFYRSDEHKHHTARMEMELSEAVDPKALRKALDQALERYDYYKVKFIKEENELLHTIVSNEQPVVITEGKEPLRLLSPQANDHALAANYEGDRLYVDIVHSITDGSALFELVKTLLYYYYKELGKEISSQGIRTLEMPVNEQERRDPYLDIPQEIEGVDVSSEKRGVIEPAMAWSEIMEIDESSQSASRIIVNEEAFMSFVKSLNSTPAITIANLLAKAIFSLKETLAAPVRLVLMKNYRPALKTPLAHNNIIGNIALNYEEKYRNLPMEKLSEIAGMMSAYQSSDDYAINAIRKRLLQEQQVLALNDLSAIRQAFQKQNEMAKKMVNLTISYLNLQLPEGLKPYVKSLSSYVDPASSHIVLEVNAIAGQFVFTFLQDFMGDQLARAFIEQLEKAGLEVKAEFNLPILYPPMQIPA